ncbi:MAG: hypothetical protein A2Z72_07750 [Omnitrophica bacterium RBG_13_46_9]|nr:MAG: hypothetical protein A2Z72_07750 [Omnitrophica bacterium RBG_13_46_9]
MNTPIGSLPEGGTSLKAEFKTDFSRVDVIRLLLQMLEKEYVKFKGSGFSPAIRDELKSYSCTLGRRVSVTTSGKRKFYGHAVDINETGALVLRLDNGLQEAFLSGDVELVR